MKLRKNSEGRVNVPVGTKKAALKREAAKIGTTETNLARILIMDGLARLISGEFVVKGPTLEKKGAA